MVVVVVVVVGLGGRHAQEFLKKTDSLLPAFQLKFGGLPQLWAGEAFNGPSSHLWRDCWSANSAFKLAVTRRKGWPLRCRKAFTHQR